MYKLENETEWTDELKQAFKHGIIKGKITFNGNEINYDNGLKDIELEDSRYVPNLGFIGQAVAKKVTINLLDSTQTTNLENQEIEVYLGADYNGETYYINYGKFIVDSAPENDDTNNSIKIVAYDYMIKFNKDYEDTIIYPCTLRALLLNICAQAGVELGTNNFANENFIVENNQFEGKNLRTVLQNIAKCAFSWARIGQDNKLYLDFNVDEEGKEVERITDDDYLQDSFKKANEYYGAINKVTYNQTNIKGQEESVEDLDDIVLHGMKELKIPDNYFSYTTAKRKELIQQGTVLFGFKYMPIQELKMIGLIYLDCNDIIEVEGTNGDIIKSIPFSHIIRYNGATNDEIKTEGMSDNEKQYTNKNSTANQNSRTEAIVDRANKQIQLITSEIGDRTEKTSTITEEINSIEAEVSEKVSFLAEVEGKGTLQTEKAMPYTVYSFDLQGYKEYNNYLYCGDINAGDSYSNGGSV